MLSIKVLGPGCVNCDRVERYALEAVERIREKNHDLELNVTKVKDPLQYMSYGLLATPGLVINEKLVSAGRIPTPDEIFNWLQEALENQPVK